MPDNNEPDAAASGATPAGAQEPSAVRPTGAAGETVVPPPEAPAHPVTPWKSATPVASPAVEAAPALEAPAAEAAQAPPPAAEPTPPRKRRERVRPIIEWRSFSGWFVLLWLLDLAWLAHATLHGPGAVTEFPKTFVAKALGGSFLAVIMAFVVPLAMLDDSSHHTRAWWVAWLWPPVMVLMLAADAMVIGGLATRLMPLVSLLKKH